MRPVELTGVQQVSDKAIHLLRRCDPSQHRPKTCHSLNSLKTSVRFEIVVDAVLLVPKQIVDQICGILILLLKVAGSYVITDCSADLLQVERALSLLTAQADPANVLAVYLKLARCVVEPRTQTCLPIEAVGCSAAGFVPVVLIDKPLNDGLFAAITVAAHNPGKPGRIGGQFKMLPLGPGE